MQRVLIFGNSGSGKSTLARALAARDQLPHLDLDTIAWKLDQPGLRADLGESQRQLMQFINATHAWVIEGCYADLLRPATSDCTTLIFLNPGIETCIQNCQTRPWEPHKYPTPAAQDANLQMLIQWVREYETREDEFSYQAHRQLFDQFAGHKIECRTNEQANNLMLRK